MTVTRTLPPTFARGVDTTAAWRRRRAAVCHTDHKGRTARIVKLDDSTFDHKLTDFTLLGGHAAAKVKCASCHQPGRRYREAPGTCNACHRKDDVHKGRLGEDCRSCHTDVRWTEVKFDHDKTKFALRNKHDGPKCVACHRDKTYKDAPLACVACHRKDDDQKGHRGRYGERCERCHDDRGWKPSIFNHDTDAKYALRGKHRAAKCESCHAGNPYKEKVAADCVSCHRKDDKHRDSLGPSAATATRNRAGECRASITTRPAIRCGASTPTSNASPATSPRSSRRHR